MSGDYRMDFVWILYVAVFAFIAAIFMWWNKIILVDHFAALLDDGGSLSVADDPQSRYPKAYYTEMDNTDFLLGLQSTFHIPCGLGERVMLEKWSDVSKDHPFAVSIYNSLLPWVSNKLNAGQPCFSLPDGSNPPFQIVAHELKRVQESPTSFLIDFETVLYRYGRFNAKHVGFTVYMDKKDKNIRNAVRVELIGVVAEDKIALFPIEAADPSESPMLDITEGYPKYLLDNEAVVEILHEQSKKLDKWAKSNIALQSSPSAS
jgi:hypothetical protein